LASVAAEACIGERAMGKVYVLGSLNIDTTYYVECLPEAGMTVIAARSKRALGGKGLNQAVAACWAGAETSLIGAVGDDENGVTLRNALLRYPINLQWLTKAPGPTGTAVIFVDALARNLIVVDGGANRFVPKDNIGFQAGDWLAAQLETNMDAVLHYFQAARKAGAYTVLNLSPYQEVPAELLRATSLLVVNEQEASLLIKKPVNAPGDILVAGAALAGLGISGALITLGRDGVLVIDSEEKTHISGITTNAVDTQGAGDAFLGVAVAALAKGKTLRQAAEYANRIAARCVEIEGSTLLSLEALKGADA
jgi:ribokinase